MLHNRPQGRQSHNGPGTNTSQHLTAGEPEQAKGLDLMQLCTVACAWCAICTYTVDAEMEMSTWLHDSWIGSNRPTSAGKEGCVTSADGVAVAME